MGLGGAGQGLAVVRALPCKGVGPRARLRRDSRLCSVGSMEGSEQGVMRADVSARTISESCVEPAGRGETGGRDFTSIGTTTHACTAVHTHAPTHVCTHGGTRTALPAPAPSTSPVHLAAIYCGRRCLKFPTSTPASQTLLPAHVREVHTGCLTQGLRLGLVLGGHQPSQTPGQPTDMC